MDLDIEKISKALVKRFKDKELGTSVNDLGLQLTIETAGFIESLIDKGKDHPMAEATDVLIHLLLICNHHEIKPSDLLIDIKYRLDNHFL